MNLIGTVCRIGMPREASPYFFVELGVGATLSPAKLLVHNNFRGSFKVGDILEVEARENHNWLLVESSMYLRMVSKAATTKQVLKKQFVYVGAARQRPSGNYEASIWLTLERFPQGVISGEALKAWFAVKPEADILDDDQSYFDWLGVLPTCSDEELSKSFRRLIRQWHPDINKEEGAAEVARKLIVAYDTLKDPTKRKKYYAGWQMAQQFQEPAHKKTFQFNDFHPRLRCGEVTFEGYYLGRILYVDKILAWDDIVNEQGQVMVTFWPAPPKDNFITVRWVEA